MTAKKLITGIILSTFIFIVLAFFYCVYFPYGIMCKKEDLEFTSSELKHLLPFKLNSLICLQDSNQNIDSLLVINIDSDKLQDPPWGIIKPKVSHTISVQVKHLHTSHLDVNDSTFFSIERSYGNKIHTYFLISYRNGYMGFESFDELHKDTVVINHKKITNYYLIKGTGINEDVFSEVYWTDEKGMVAYKRNNGITGVIIND